MTAPVPAAARGVAAALILACGCMPLPPEGGGINVGATSDQWTVRFDPVLGCPSSLVNRALQDAPVTSTSQPAGEKEAVAAVLAVFRSRPEWFRLRSEIDDFRAVRSETRGWLRYLRFEQTYRGVSVAGAGYEAHVLPNGRVGSLEGRYYPDMNVEVRPVFGADQAEDRARALFQPGAPAPGNVTGVQFELENGFREPRVLTIVPQGRNFVLAWGVVVALDARERARVYVDARDGSVFARQSIGWTGSR